MVYPTSSINTPERRGRLSGLAKLFPDSVCESLAFLMFIQIIITGFSTHSRGGGDCPLQQFNLGKRSRVSINIILAR